MADITSSSMHEDSAGSNDFISVFKSLSVASPELRQVELRLAKAGPARKGLVVLELNPKRLAVEDVFRRHGESGPVPATTDGHDQSVYYEYKRPAGIIRFGASRASANWMTTIVIDRF